MAGRVVRTAWWHARSVAAVEHIMGMPIGIDVAAGATAGVEAAFAWLREADATFSTYREDSDISRLDRGELTISEVAPDVRWVLDRCDEERMPAFLETAIQVS